jgi:hypothetical protein
MRFLELRMKTSVNLIIMKNVEFENIDRIENLM